MRARPRPPLAIALAALALGCALARPAAAQTAAGEPETPAIRPGQTVRGTLTDEDVDLFDDAPAARWRIAGRGGERLRIHVTSPDFEPFVSLDLPQAAGGAVLAYRSGPAGPTGATLETTLPADGDYTIEATVLDPSGRGIFVLSVEVVRT
ncbi:MAG: Pre-peptidase C-terminal protein [Gemmatimonadetes bacterium]|nr:Pre-peptidase C-terminal protein [Gemmatimonadota bacterium]